MYHVVRFVLPSCDPMTSFYLLLRATLLYVLAHLYSTSTVRTVLYRFALSRSNTVQYVVRTVQYEQSKTRRTCLSALVRLTHLTHEARPPKLIWLLCTCESSASHYIGTGTVVH